MSRLTVRGTTSQIDINRLLELSNDNQFGRNEAYYKLQHYEDLEEQGHRMVNINKIIKQLEELEKEYPYRVVGEPETYSQYNEGWRDCIDRAIGIVKGSE